MSKNNPAQCVVCGCQFELRSKAGEVSITIRITGRSSVVVAGPVCHDCASKSADPRVALDQMRSARAFLLADSISTSLVPEYSKGVDA